MKQLNRKEFLRLLGLGGLALSGLGKWDQLQAATTGLNTLIHLILEGGPDWRHLFVPTPSSNTSSYGYKFWNNRATSMGRGSSANNPTKWQEIYSNYYEEISLSGNTFGVLKYNNGNADANGWLRSMIKANKVAIINNVAHSTSRDHAHSRSVIQSGQYDLSASSNNAGGWGGRLINQLAGGNTGNARLISLSGQIRQFCNTINKQNVLSFTNSRDFGFEVPRVTNSVLNPNDGSLRSAGQYYRNLESGIGSPVLTGTVYEKFLKQWSKVNTLTDSIRAQLPAPASGESLSSLYSTGVNNLFTGSGRLKTQYFASQIRNLIDAFKVQDLLKMRIASLNYEGWDSHKNQLVDIEPQFNDLFGTDKAFHTLFNEVSGIWNTTSIVISGDFGRQLKSNGDVGTDHGRGNTILVIGGPVIGGVYGEMFPAIESANDGSGKSPLDYYNKDIEGRTMIDHVFGKLCTWMGGTGVGGVFTNSTPSTLKNHTGGIETGVTLNFI